MPVSLRNLSLLGSTAAQHLVDDPVHLLVQASRRLPSIAADRLAAFLRRTPTRSGRALGLWMGGRHDELNAVLQSAATDLRAARTPARRLVQEIAVLARREDLLPAIPGRLEPSTAARAAWNRGDLTGAIELLSGTAHSRYCGTLEGERAALTPGWFPAPRRPRRPSAAVLSAARGFRRSAGAPRVLHVLTNSLPHTQSGYTLRTQHILSAQRDAGMAVLGATRIGYPVMVGKTGAADVDLVDGVAYVRFLPWQLTGTQIERMTLQAAWLWGLVEAAQPDVLHCTTNYTNALVTKAVADRAGIPWVYEVRGMLEQTWAASQPMPEARAAAVDSERYRLIRDRETEVARAADAVVTLGPTMCDDLVERGVERDRISLVPNAIDASMLDRTGDPANARRNLGLPPDGFWVGGVSSLVDYEGFDTVLHAVRILRDAGLDVRALIAGDGVSRPRLRALADELGLSAWVVLPGRIPAIDAPRYAMALDAVTVIRRDVEVCRTVTPLKPIEAMALGRPVIASDLPALASLLHGPEGDAGFLVRPDAPQDLAETVARIRRQPDEAESQVTIGRRIAAERTWHAQVRTYERVYRGVGAGATA